MWFEYIYKEIEMKGTLKYFSDEQSFFYDPWKKNDFSIIVGSAHSGLDVVSDSGEVVQLSGLSPMKQWKIEKLFFPYSLKGSLFVRDAMLIKGSAVDYKIEWPTYYDPNERVICIGSPFDRNRCKYVEFCNGIVACLRDNDLVSIWAKIEYI